MTTVIFYGMLFRDRSVTNTNDGTLRWDVFTSKRPGLSRDLPPGKEALMLVSNSSTLIYGERDAVLVDTLLTIDQSQALLNWVVTSGKSRRLEQEISVQERATSSPVRAHESPRSHGDRFAPSPRYSSSSRSIRACSRSLNPTGSSNTRSSAVRMMTFRVESRIAEQISQCSRCF